MTSLVAATSRGNPILTMSDLTVSFPSRYGGISVLDLGGVELAVGSGECVAVVGESGCGKSLLGLAAANLLPETAEVNGAIAFHGRDIRRLRARESRGLRGAGIGIVYQDALTSLNPGMTIGAQLRQVCRLGTRLTPEQLLSSVRLPDTERILHARPFQLSGGQRQRVLIAIALAREPDVVIADEPTTALDVTVQAQIIDLLQDLQKSRHFALLFISHDLALVSQLADRMVVMYAGQIVEIGSTSEILYNPRHPYTAGLLSASLSLDRGRELSSIPGAVRQPIDFPTGCRFRDRCTRVLDQCISRPTLEMCGKRQIACFSPVGADQSAVVPDFTTAR